MSIENLDVSVNESLLRVCWVLFALTILLGPISVFLETRAQYAIQWRSIQAQDFERRGSTPSEKAQLFALVLYTVLVRPRNLIFVRDTDSGIQQKAWLSAIQKLHAVWDLALGLELAFWLTFVGALGLLIASILGRPAGAGPHA